MLCEKMGVGVGVGVGVGGPKGRPRCERKATQKRIALSLKASNRMTDNGKEASQNIFVKKPCFKNHSYWACNERWMKTTDRRQSINILSSTSSGEKRKPHASSSQDFSPSPQQIPSQGSLLDRAALVSDSISKCFPVFVGIASTIALLSPSVFSWFNGTMLIFGLMFTMTSMGTTLSPTQLIQAIRSGREILTGFCLQYTIMPMLGYGVSHMMNLSAEHTAGLILVSCCPGGVASNVVCYIAKANVALSVALTSVSTIAAVVMTPLLTSFLLGKSVQVDPMALFGSTVKVVLLPVLIGSMLSQKAPKLTSGIAAVAPAVSVIAVVFINASVVAQSSSSIIATGLKLILSCMFLHTGGFFLGYVISKYVLKLDERTCRTMSVEVGMQNSTLGAYLAVNHFSVLAAAPCAVSAVFHSGIGSVLAYFWGANTAEPQTSDCESS